MRVGRLPYPAVMAAVLVAFWPAVALAVGGGDDEPPRPTPTSRCPEGQIWNPETERCEEPDSRRHSDRVLYEAARELAYLGRYEAARRVLDAMPDQEDDRVLTYRGFLARMLGEMETAFAWYRRALAKNPDNVLARSYLGQGLVAVGRRSEAEAELAEIERRAGKESWAYRALAEALATGRTYQY